MEHSVGQVTMEPSNVSRRGSKVINFAEKQCLRNYIERVAKIKINGINLMPGMNQGSNEVKISNKICGCRFRFDKSMLMGIKFGLEMV
jgi:hypothetical protein